MPARPKDRYRMFEVKPALGGTLITRGSSDNASLFNYVTKRDWRRDLDQEIRREGHDYFWPNLSLPIGGQPFPSLIVLDSLTFSGGIVTATRLSGQWFSSGETVIITGANDPLYNGSFLILTVTPTTFTYAVSGSPASPDTGTTIFAQADEAITLLSLARRPNGQIAVIAGSQRRLYRYYALEDPDYISHDAVDYPVGTAADQLSYWSDGTRYVADQNPLLWNVGNPISQMEYVDENPGYWIVIGSGYSLEGRRWETASINGYMVFNNGVDLPCTYRVEDMAVVPIYQMREQGIASVGTISEINGILMAADLTEIYPSQIADWFNTAGKIKLDSLTFAAGVVTATRAAGVPYVVGQKVVVSGANDPLYNVTSAVTAITPTTFQYAITGIPGSSPDTSTAIYSSVPDAAYGTYPFDQYLDRTQFRIGWATPGEPRDWGLVVPGSMVVGSNVITLDYPVKGFAPGQELTVTGAGTPHAGGTSDNLAGNIINISGNSIVIDTFCETAVTSVPVEATSSIGSIVGFEDLQDDGSGILKMLPLADQLVIYKDTSIFIGTYLGTPTQPFAFSPRRIQKEQGLYYRNTLWLVETPTEMFQVYAGRNAFYRFDLTNQQPMILPKFEACSDIFFSRASLANTERIFASENGITHEIVFVWPMVGNPFYTTTPDAMLCWDYKWNSLSTSSAVITAASTVRKPLTGPASGAEQDWFIMGTQHGAVLLYGLTNEPQPQPDWNNLPYIFFRREAVPHDPTRIGYDSVEKSGLVGFGNDYAEKDVRAFLTLMASQSPDTQFLVNIYRTQNANLPTTLVASRLFTNPNLQNLLPMMLRGFYFQSETIVSGMDNPCRLVGSLWNAAPVDSRSLPRG